MRTSLLLFASALAGASPRLAAAAGCTTPNPPPSIPDVALRQIASGFSSPLEIKRAPEESRRLFVVEREGVIRVLDGRTVLSEPFLDIQERVEAGGEKGLLSVAFHPRFTENGRLFVDYTAPYREQLRTTISEFTADPGLEHVDPATERVLLRVTQPYDNHNGGTLAFGPDGYLYLSLGDGGSANDPEGHAQNLGDLLGSILRIDPDSRTGRRRYGIPADNPFVGVSGARPEIWAYGFRNPWRMSFDRRTGQLFAGDVGQGAREEIDVVRRGGNYGWNVMEGNICTPGVNASCSSNGFVAPILDYPHGDECSVTGGFVYRGRQIPDLCGAYLYGDYCSGRIWALRTDGRRATTNRLLLDTDLSISSFGENRPGEIYVVDLGGTIHKIVPP
jgi:glucose/arabinose dehydrogenase